MESDIQRLNEQYAIPGHVTFFSAPGGLAAAAFENEHAQATLTLAGAHLMQYTPRGGQPLLWASPRASAELGNAMRGGVPVCWPWFAHHPSQAETMPLHGLVRTMHWQVSDTRALPDGATEIRLQVRDTPETLQLWPHPFRLELIATIGRRLRLEWIAHNPGDSSYTYTGALHPYFAVSNARAVTVHGLAGADYLDKNEDLRRKRQAGPLRVTGRLDAIFLDTEKELVIEDEGLGRALRIVKTGSRTTVVWNPADEDAQMDDVGAGQHRRFLCVEAANAVDDVVTVAPGGTGRLGMEIWAE